jgi:hypothetical protein
MTTQQMECPEVRISLGVYVLGAIDPAERAQVESHLVTCRECRDELAGLAGLPALLARVSAEEAAALAVGPEEAPGKDGTDGQDKAIAAAATARTGGAPPPELLATVLDLTKARRRRRRLTQAGVGVAAALLVAAGVFGGLRAGGGSSAPSAAAAAGMNNPGTPNGPWQTFTTAASGMSTTVQYRSMGWGTQLQVKVNGIPRGTFCQLYIIGPNGSRTLAGSWVTDNHEGAVWYPASAGVPASGVHGLEVTVAGSKPLTLTT